MVYKVEKYIAKHNLLSSGGKVIVALSGGADSVALLIALRKLGYRCSALHCNFHLRGKESDRDELFVTALCERTGTDLHIVHFDTASYAKEHGISIEMAARELRYAAFEEYRAYKDAEAIAVAHHRDDSAETVLLNLIRGTGIRGLHGIQPKNGYIVRPLLCVGREEILEYLEWRNEDYVTDSTNLTSDYTRNKIRLEIIPKLAEINPSIKESLAATAQRLSEAELIYNNAVLEAINRVKSDNRIDINALQKEISPSTVLYEILSPLGFNSTQVANMAEAASNEGYREISNEKWQVIKDRDTIMILPRKKKENISIELPAEGYTETTLGTISIESKQFDGNIPKERFVAMLDTAKLHMPLRIRNIQEGDRFVPYGMRGSKLVSDYLTDRKKSITEKHRQLAVTDADGNIVWLVGERPAAPYCVSGKTLHVTFLTWQEP